MTLAIMDKFVGPMPVDDFLKEFVPEAPMACPKDCVAFSKDFSASNTEGTFIDAIHGSGLCPNLRFKNTTNGVATTSLMIKPDISVFSRSHFDAGADWGATEFWIENKRASEDFFIPDKSLRADPKNPLSHLAYNKGLWPVCGQMIEYASTLHRIQFRVFSFSVALFGNTGRLFRWDRSGVVYTQPFEWTTHPETLFEFFWRFNYLSPAERGHDPTVFPATEDEIARALPKLRTREGYEDLRGDNFSKFLVQDDVIHDEEPRYYIASTEAAWTTNALVGRATFGYLAYDLATGGLVYLKDFWRLDLPDIQKEGDIYRELEGKNVSHIAKLGRAGDVPLNPGSKRSTSVQRTRTQDFVKEAGLVKWCPGRPRVEPYVHYRLVLNTLGKPLHQFKSTRQLCEVIRDAIIAHSEAYGGTGILHRDVSAGNILIGDDGKGILIDWDLSKKLPRDGGGRPRRATRTGTWQFISMGLLMNPTTRPHELQDDLESFFWVLLYQIVQCRGAHMSMRQEFRDAITHVFDSSAKSDTLRAVVGGTGKCLCLKDSTLASGIIEELVKTPCNEIVEEMRGLFADFYLHVAVEAGLFSESMQRKIEEKRARDPLVQAAHTTLRSSRALLDILEKHLKSPWEITDDASEYLGEIRPSALASKKRKHGQAFHADPREDFYPARRWYSPPGSSSRPASIQQRSLSYHSDFTLANSPTLHGNVLSSLGSLGKP
ncbi:hypothetical protein BC834DRAFT_1030174 [Gloeopeniophorella convolvens]|nr:hypothetical protein BC834DRAFT_1030174 [Gloeopeniophorella convolvens]